MKLHGTLISSTPHRIYKRVVLFVNLTDMIEIDEVKSIGLKPQQNSKKRG